MRGWREAIPPGGVRVEDLLHGRDDVGGADRQEPHEDASNALFGDLAMRLGFLSQKQLEIGLELQRGLEKGAAKKRTLLGVLLVELGCLTEDQVLRVLEKKTEIERLAHEIDDYPRVVIQVEEGVTEDDDTDRVVIAESD